MASVEECDRRNGEAAAGEPPPSVSRHGSEPESRQQDRADRDGGARRFAEFLRCRGMQEERIADQGRRRKGPTSTR
ncbi:MAG: hypothetical protein MZW92_37925 [Comamonadaceae bacterium]|nr:hypothetical protein [Comamonadaceae bacterium]